MTDRVPSLIRGEWRAAEDGEVPVEPIFDPATGDTISLLPHSTSDEVDAAVASARQAFPGWANTPVPDRAQVMFRFKRVLEDHFDEMAELVVRENGKTLASVQKARYGLSWSQAKRLVEKRHVKVSGQVETDVARRLKVGKRV